jgi:hypothetical protein
MLISASGKRARSARSVGTAHRKSPILEARKSTTFCGGAGRRSKRLGANESFSIVFSHVSNVLRVNTWQSGDMSGCLCFFSACFKEQHDRVDTHTTTILSQKILNREASWQGYFLFFMMQAQSCSETSSKISRSIETSMKSMFQWILRSLSLSHEESGMSHKALLERYV